MQGREPPAKEECLAEVGAREVAARATVYSGGWFRLS